MDVIDEKNITLQKELNELDRFVLKSLEIIQKHASYALISDYLASLCGSIRKIEEADVMISLLSPEQFNNLYNELLQQGFWCIHSENVEEIYSMLKEGVSAKFAQKGVVIPYLGLQFAQDNFDTLVLTEKIKVELFSTVIYIGSPALQVAYKRFVLKRPQDEEDAECLQHYFNLNEEKIIKARMVLVEYGKIN